MINNRRLAQARGIVRATRDVMAQRGLDPSLVYRWLAVERRGRAYLIGILNDRRAEPERYTSSNLLHHFSTAIKGPVAVSNTRGLRYIFTLDRTKPLARVIEFPGCELGKLRLGVGHSGEVATTWGAINHLMVVGKTGTGKSVFLRSLAYQAIASGAQLLLSDLDSTTFSILQGHSSLLAPITSSVEDAGSLVSLALAECDYRASLFSAANGYPENLQEYNATAITPLPEIVVIFDEFNATVSSQGGARGKLAQAAASLGWRGRKFGIRLVFAAQAFDKQIVGAVRDQVGDVIAFRVDTQQTARNCGVAGAYSLPVIPGRAMSREQGVFQAYLLPRSKLIGLRSQSQPPPLPDSLLGLVRWAVEENDRYLSLANIQERGGLGQYAARELAREWERREWLEKDRQANNRRRVTGALEKLALSDETRAESAIDLHSTNATNDDKPPTDPQAHLQTDA